MEFNKQGVLVIGDNMIYKCPCDKTARLTMSFNDFYSYIILVSRKSISSNNTIKMYELTLAAGDTVVDNTSHLFQANDELIVSCSSPTTNYLLHIIEE